MIRFLSIRRLAVIDSVDVELEPGFNVLTGETGAGKSIVVGALSLLLGGRGSPGLIRTGADVALVQAVFETPAGEELIIRRELSAQGRSRAFLNDTLVASAALKDACGSLVSLHGQHEHHVLLNPSVHLDLLDEFAGLGRERQIVAARYVELIDCMRTVEEARANSQSRIEERDRLRFQLRELDGAAARVGEDAELDAARRVLANAEKLERLCRDSYADLYESDDAILGRLSTLWRRLGELAMTDPAFRPYLDARDQIDPHLEDLAYFLRSYAARLDASPERLQEVENRLAALERLKRKYGPLLEDVLEHQHRIRERVRALETAGERLAECEAALGAVRQAYDEAAGHLSRARQTSAPQLADRLAESAAELALPRARCEIRFAHDGTPQATERGIDQAEFYFSANPGEELRPLARVASGGELSRVMLALKTLAPADSPGTTLVFDEVDAGIGGRVADVVGRKLRELGDRYQVLCITHLPQIAAYGTTHFRVSKQIHDSRTTTIIEPLDRAGRSEELARMIGGSVVTAAARASAEDLLAGAAGPQCGEPGKQGGEPRGRTRHASAGKPVMKGKRIG